MECEFWLSAQSRQMAKDFHVEKLADEFSQYVLYLKCESCLHERRTSPHLLANLCGWGRETKRCDTSATVLGMWKTQMHGAGRPHHCA
jgi:hypothetical protein